MRGIKQALKASSFFFQLFKRQLQSAGAHRLHLLAKYLIGAARFVNRDFSAHDDFEAIVGLKTQALIEAAHHDGVDLRLGVL